MNETKDKFTEDLGQDTAQDQDQDLNQDQEQNQNQDLNQDQDQDQDQDHDKDQTQDLDAENVTTTQDIDAEEITSQGGSGSGAADGKLRLPLIPLRGIVLLPYLHLTFDVSRDLSREAIGNALEGDMLIFVTAQKDSSIEFPDLDSLYQTGCVAKISQVIEINETGILRLTLEGLYRAKINDPDFDGHEYVITVEKLEDQYPQGSQDQFVLEATRRGVVEAYQTFSMETGRQNRDQMYTLVEETDASILADRVASQALAMFHDRQSFLEQTNVSERLAFLLAKLNREIILARYGKSLNEKVKENVDKGQREYFLREQIKVIQNELGDASDNRSAADDFREKLASMKISDQAREKLAKEIDKLTSYAPQNPEASVLRNYLETVFDLPWGKVDQLDFDLTKIRRRLDKDHYGLEQVKERIMEYIAVSKLRAAKGERRTKGPILCLVGPPGVGKTSVASSVAAAMGRAFVRMSLGGVRDEAEIRGHRRTYIGSMPGRIINAMTQAGSDNPLILMDEIDKLSADYKGDPSSALLEVLDPEQNNTFRDHYLELPYDLSQVLFITTANRADQIPPALFDRMEVIELNGYTVPEKIEIAKRHLLPKQMKENALEKGQLTVQKAALTDLISNYTAEAGVRQLERALAKICRKAALEIAAAKDADSDSNPDPKVKVTAQNLQDYAGKPRYHYDKAGKKPLSGLVRGLAWTAAGGDTLEIEALTMPGNGKLNITGQLGDVMQESCQVALAYVRSRSEKYEIPDDFFEKHDIHVHVPEGATPKDGPSAGITLVVAIASAITKRKVEPSLAMTGEVTLRGRVLPIGGLKEKLIAADRAGIKTVIIPEDNRRDLDDVPESVLSKLTIHFAQDAQEVLDLAL